MRSLRFGMAQVSALRSRVVDFRGLGFLGAGGYRDVVGLRV